MAYNNQGSLIPESEMVAWILNSNEIRIRCIASHTVVISHSLFNNLNEVIEPNWFVPPASLERDYPYDSPEAE